MPLTLAGPWFSALMRMLLCAAGRCEFSPRQWLKTRRSLLEHTATQLTTQMFERNWLKVIRSRELCQETSARHPT